MHSLNVNFEFMWISCPFLILFVLFPTFLNFKLKFPNFPSIFRVLKPPGGGSTDIFGGEDSNMLRPSKNHMKSTIFASPEAPKPGKFDKIQRFSKMAVKIVGRSIKIMATLNFKKSMTKTGPLELNQNQ